MKTICNISRFIGEIFVFVGKFGLFVYFVLRMLLISVTIYQFALVYSYRCF